jgi:hypothetical protein
MRSKVRREEKYLAQSARSSVPSADRRRRVRLPRSALEQQPEEDKKG